MPMNVRAAVLHGPNQPFSIETVQLEGPGAGEVLIQVKATGLCHSDLNVYEGKSLWQFPTILGHEAAGIVERAQSRPVEVPLLAPMLIKFLFSHKAASSY